MDGERLCRIPLSTSGHAFGRRGYSTRTRKPSAFSPTDAQSPATLVSRATVVRGADRALRGQVMNAPLQAGSFAIRRQRRGARFALPGVRRPHREGASHICVNLRSMPIAARRSTRQWLCCSTTTRLFREPRRQDVQRLHDHIRRRRERAAAGLCLRGGAPRYARG